MTILLLIEVSISAAASNVANPLRTASPDRSAKAGELAAAPAFSLTLEKVTGGLSDPVYLTHAGDGSGRLFVVERAGRIRVIANNQLLSTPYLDIQSQVESGYEEQGLLSIAFDPNYKTNGTFYVDYTTNVAGHDGDTVIARYVVANPAADVATVLTTTTILLIYQPAQNHNGGQLQFGPLDHDLYIGMGDGGGEGDPYNNGQSLNTLLGKILRINVQGVPSYTIPASNPFIHTAGADPEIWAYGVRNPWRFTFDRANGDMYIGDVGQACWEEIDWQPGSSTGGQNYSWNLMEGFHQYNPASGCNTSTTPPISGLTAPVAEYYHDYGLPYAVVGGYVYRGTRYPQMAGAYFYADHEQGLVWSLAQTSPGTWVSSQQLNMAPADISSFGEDESGELYLITYTNGDVFHIAASSAGPTSTPTATSAPSQTPTPSATPNGEVVNPTNIASLAVGTNVLLNFDNFTNPADNQPIPANYAGCTWTSLVEGSPWAGDATWNIYVANGGPQGTITFPRPVLVRSIRVSSNSGSTFTLSSPGNPDVSLTTSGSNPQVLTTGWATPVTSLTLHSSTGDQVFDDLQLTMASTTSTPTNTATPTPTKVATATSTPTRTATPTPSATPGGEVINPANIGTLSANTNVLLNFDNFTNPADNQPIPANYAGCTWTSLVEGSPWAGDATWNIYVANGGPQGTITFPRPVLVRSIRVSSNSGSTFTLNSPGNPNVSLTVSGNSPQTLTTGWTVAVTSLTLRSSSGDQVFDDLRLTTN